MHIRRKGEVIPARDHAKVIPLTGPGDDFVALRDHTVILDREGRGEVVHLSHNLIAPSARRTGLAGWMRKGRP